MNDSSLFDKICSIENLELAFKRARKRRSNKKYVIAFEKNLAENLRQLQNELISQTYKPKPLQTFILQDPKTRKISKSHFRDRIIHHALCNVIEPIFDKSFIFDSYANRKGKGTLKAIQRFDFFKRKVSKNNSRKCFVLKADIKQYFDSVDHEILLSLVERKITDSKVIWLIRTILSNFKSSGTGKGMPLGNLTSQFFANVYLNELDYFIKHKWRAKHYIRYVDDFIVLSNSKKELVNLKLAIDRVLKKLGLELHPEKSKIKTLANGITFLGFRNFIYHKLITKKNIRKFQRKVNELHYLYQANVFERKKAFEMFQGWIAFIVHANTFKFRQRLWKSFELLFPSPAKIKLALWLIIQGHAISFVQSLLFA